MSNKRLKVLTVALSLWSLSGVLDNASAATDTTLAEIAPYRQSTRVTVEPIHVAGALVAYD
jgi:hypothetical protein